MMDTKEVLHPFERAGLGKAPFAYVGMSEKVYVACPGAPEQPAGTCDYCGQGIRYCCGIRSADGKEFVVGCDCVRKLGRADNRLVTKVEAEMKVIERKKNRERRAVQVAKEDQRIAAAFAALDANEAIQEAMKAKPHPRGLEGRSLLDYVTFLRFNAGHSGCLTTARIIEKHTEAIK